jgi:hypothetical protein
MNIQTYRNYVNLPFILLYFYFNLVYVIYSKLKDSDFIFEYKIKDELVPKNFEFFDTFILNGKVEDENFYLKINNENTEFKYKSYSVNKKNIFSFIKDKKIEIIDEKFLVQIYRQNDKLILEIHYEGKFFGFKSYINNTVLNTTKNGFLKINKLHLIEGQILIDNNIIKLKKESLIFYEIKGQLNEKNIIYQKDY